MISTGLKYNDISMYIPYDLKFKLTHKGIFNLDEEYPDNSIHNATYNLQNCCFKYNQNELDVEIEIADTTKRGNFTIGYIELDEVYPLLHSMNDINKLFTHQDILNGKLFSPLDMLIGMDRSSIGDINLNSVKFIQYIVESYEIQLEYKDNRDNLINYFMLLDYDKLQFLSKLYLDYNDLIGKGKALDYKNI